MSEAKNEKHYIQKIKNDNILGKAKELIQSGQKDCFYLFDPSSITRRMQMWKKYLPEVEMFYAIKSNPDPVIVNKMVNNGHGFDCASMGEIENVLRSGVDPKKIIYANPVKKIEHIIYAKERGVSLMTFDSCEEAMKIKKYFPDA